MARVTVERALAALLPEESEVHGLVALMGPQISGSAPGSATMAANPGLKYPWIARGWLNCCEIF